MVLSNIAACRAEAAREDASQQQPKGWGRATNATSLTVTCGGLLFAAHKCYLAGRLCRGGKTQSSSQEHRVEGKSHLGKGGGGRGSIRWHQRICGRPAFTDPSYGGLSLHLHLANAKVTVGS